MDINKTIVSIILDGILAKSINPLQNIFNNNSKPRIIVTYKLIQSIISSSKYPILLNVIKFKSAITSKKQFINMLFNSFLNKFFNPILNFLTQIS